MFKELDSEELKLIDFGLSTGCKRNQLITTFAGSPYYMSPELFKYKPYNYKSDIWALGCVIYEICNLKHAFNAQTLNGLALKILKGNYMPISTNYS